MANTTYSLISSYLPSIWEAAMMHAMQSTFMPSIVQVWNDRTGGVARSGSKYSAGTVASLAEGTDISVAQTLTRTAFGTITPAEVGDMYLITDLRVESEDVMDIFADAALVIGHAMAKSVETNLLSAFTSFTGEANSGTIGTAGGTLTISHIFAAASQLRAAGAPGPYNCVLHEYQWYHIAKGLETATPLIFTESLRQAGGFYVGSFGDINFYTTGVPSAGTAVVSGIFSRAAIGYDIRRPLRIAPQRDESLRATELVWTHVYAYGAWRKDFGIPLVGTAAAPTS